MFQRMKELFSKQLPLLFFSFFNILFFVFLLFLLYFVVALFFIVLRKNLVIFRATWNNLFITLAVLNSFAFLSF